MKTTGLIAGLMMLITSAFAQNYIGLSQSKIQKMFGKPETQGENFIVYLDENEEGTNTYYFNENKECTAFVISRTADYLSFYKKLLKKDFVSNLNNETEFKSKKDGFKAELKLSEKDFSIKITKEDIADSQNQVCVR